MAALAFLDGYVVSGDSTYLTRAQECVTTILTNCWGFTNGAEHGAWYSDNANDHVATTDYYVLNVNALTLAALARIKALTGTSPDATKQGQIETLLSTEHNAGGTTGAWNYQISGLAGLNDVEHASLMTEGAVWDATADASNSITYLWSLFGANGTFSTSDTNMMGSDNWGPGEAMSALVLGGDIAHATLLGTVLAASVHADGTSSFATASDPRSIARYGLGLARFAAKLNGNGSLFP